MTHNTEHDYIEKVNASTNIVLNRKYEFDRDMFESDIPKLFNKSNFVSLLNFPRNIKMFGPPWLYWEGGYCGEKVIQQLKSLINGLIPNWETSVLQRYYREKSLHLILDDISFKTIKEDVKSNFLKGTLHKNYKRYKTDSNAISKFNDNEPLSVLYVDGEEFVVMLSADEYLQLSYDKNVSVCRDVSGLPYFKWIIDHHVIQISRIIKVMKECILLPHVANRGFYHVMASDWSFFSDKFRFVLS